MNEIKRLRVTQDESGNLKRLVKTVDNDSGYTFWGEVKTSEEFEKLKEEVLVKFGGSKVENNV